jgi:hypothetical protein
MPNPVKIFKERCAELGDPNRSLFVAKLAKPTFSCGIRKKMIMIKKTLTINPKIFNIDLGFFKNNNL